jgi:hypothetical protein
VVGRERGRGRRERDERESCNVPISHLSPTDSLSRKRDGKKIKAQEERTWAESVIAQREKERAQERD